MNKRVELLHLLVQEHLDILILCEVLPKNFRYFPQPAELNFCDYECFSNCFNNDNVHRGVAVYIKKSLNPQQVCMSEKQLSSRESIWAEIKLDNEETLLVGGVYRPPSNTEKQNKDLYESVLSIIEGRSHVLMCGDFNHPDIDWIKESSPESERHPATIFMEFVRDSFLIQHVSNPTHFKPHTRPSLIDLIFTSEENMLENLKHSAPVGKSHHQCLFFDFVCSVNASSRNNVKKFNYSKADYSRMKQHVDDFDISSKIEEKGIEEKWEVFALCISSAVENCVPKINPKQNDDRRKPKFWNDQTNQKVQVKREAYQTWLRSQNPKDYDLYAKARNKAKSECRKGENEYQKKIAREAKKNPKLFYSFVNSKMKVKAGIADLVDSNGDTVSEDSEKAEVLNSFFCSVFTEERKEEVPTCEKKNDQDYLNNIVFTKEKVLKKLKNLDPSKSGGPDEINARVLKELADEIAEPLADIFQCSMNEGKLPKVWKDANVTPLFKKGEKAKPNNYRPVSLTCILCKVMESVIRDELVLYLEESNLLSPFQHGFISHRSCTTNLLATLDAWTEMIDSGSSVDAIYLDFSKAFDSVPHLRLLEKLKAYGICEKLLYWIEDFLIGRRQRVCVNGAYSQWSPVTSGVPQGSCLGPVLFVIFINDLPEVVESLCQMYADDTKVFSKSDNEELKNKIQKDLDNLTMWADKWQLRFNADKCHVLHLGYRNQHHQYHMRKHDSDESVELAISYVEKDLGVLVDNDLKFTQHIESQVKKANRLLGLIRRSFTFMDKECMKLLFTSLVRPHLEFGNVAWSPYLEKHIKAIENVQHRATKMIPGLKNKPYEERLKEMKLPSLKYRRKRGDLIEAYKYTHGFYHVNQDLLQFDTDSRTRGHAYKLKKQRSRLDVRKNFFSVRIVNEWNNLPANVAEAPTLNTFKARLDRLYTDEMYCE